MINESYIYKDELNRIADRMEKRLIQKRWTDHSWFLFEKDVFVSFYIIRKLIEAKSKISTKTANMKVKLLKYKPMGTTPTIMNHFKIDDLYYMDKPYRTAEPISFLCNQIIHSYIFFPYINKNKRSLAVLFNSFYERSKALYHLSVTDLIYILRKISEDYPSTISYRYNPDNLDYEVNTGDVDAVKARKQKKNRK